MKKEKSVSAQRRHKDALENPEANRAAKSGVDESAPAKRVAKVVNLIISVGDNDRDVNYEDWIEGIRKSIGATGPIEKSGKRTNKPHMAVTGGYYIVDGKVCLPGSYDAKRQNFKKGHAPPSWASGEPNQGSKISKSQTQMDYDLENLSSDEYDKKYRIGKYSPKFETEGEHVARMRAQRHARKEERRIAEEKESAELEAEEIQDVESRLNDGSIDRAAKDIARRSVNKRRVIKRAKSVESVPTAKKRRIVKRKRS